MVRLQLLHTVSETDTGAALDMGRLMFPVSRKALRAAAVQNYKKRPSRGTFARFALSWVGFG